MRISKNMSSGRLEKGNHDSRGGGAGGGGRGEGGGGGGGEERGRRLITSLLRRLKCDIASAKNVVRLYSQFT